MLDTPTTPKTRTIMINRKSLAYKLRTITQMGTFRTLSLFQALERFHETMEGAEKIKENYDRGLCVCHFKVFTEHHDTMGFIEVFQMAYPDIFIKNLIYPLTQE